MLGDLLSFISLFLQAAVQGKARWLKKLNLRIKSDSD